ncbi:reverse transcriptase [Daphnia sinensis]|uniref:Reverse transcriptase n=1 Tax=Daphnia sinensis TaxID=1820382 RepID=A0AAD5KLA6_9CRUS|nr:reverse transcriptase [Daphnia sinensis]
MHPDMRKFLQFRWEGDSFRCTTLCFGLSSTPWTFKKLLKPLVTFLWKSGIRFIVYLDDFLILNQKKEGAERDFGRVTDLLRTFGFLINEGESVGIATQNREFLGLMIDSLSLSLSLPPSKVNQIMQICRSAASGSKIQLRNMARILGSLTWTIQAVPYAQVHFRHLQRLYNSQSLLSEMDLSVSVKLDEESKSDLSWWADNLERTNGKAMAISEPDLIIFSDASRLGWGASLNSATTKGPWTSQDLGFCGASVGISGRIMLDNVTTVHYINKARGSRSRRLTDISAQIVKWGETRELSVHAIHLLGALNFVADRLSRSEPDAIGNYARKYSSTYSGSLWNRQLDSCVSWRLQPGALTVDAFSVNWTWMRGYAFPPFCLIQKILSKTMRDLAEITLIAPCWLAQAWFPTVLELVSEPPLKLPPEGNLREPLGQSYPLAGSLILIAWQLSGKSFKSLAFRRKWSSNSWKELGSDAMSPSIGHVLEFLGALARIEGVKIGKPPLVIRLLKGIYIRTPPTPRYTGFWDVAAVVDYFMAMNVNEDLSFSILSRKYAMLLALSSLGRVDLKRLVPVNRKCPVATLEAYLLISDQFRKGIRSDSLFLSLRAPHHSVGASTLSRSLKATLEKTSIDTSIYSVFDARCLCFQSSGFRHVDTGHFENGKLEFRIHFHVLLSSTDLSLEANTLELGRCIIVELLLYNSTIARVRVANKGPLGLYNNSETLVLTRFPPAIARNMLLICFSSAY